MEEEKLLIYQGLRESPRAVWTTVHLNGTIYRLRREAVFQIDGDDQPICCSIYQSCRVLRFLLPQHYQMVMVMIMVD
jgi:hypothetical protein